jgi:hypothetical protein
MLDDTPLPPLVVDFKGFHIDAENDPVRVAAEILGDAGPEDSDLVQLLQRRLNKLAEDNSDPNDPFGEAARRAPLSGSHRGLSRRLGTDGLDATALRRAALFQRETDWHRRRPPMPG